ncbi:MAG: VWA domain-containing protein [Catalinimonas sp.]
MKEDDFRQFIQFGELFDRSTRRWLVRYLIHKFEPPANPLEAIEVSDPQFDHLKATLDRTFDQAVPRRVLADHEALATQVLQDTLQWLRQTKKKIEVENPYQDEFRRLRSWQERPLRIFAESWYHLTNFLREQYERHELDVLFYQERFDDAFRDRVGFVEKLDAAYAAHGTAWQHPIEPVIEDLLRRWEALLVARALRYEVERMEEEQEAFSERLNEKIDEFDKLLRLIAPFTLDVSRFWDVDRGLWQRKTFDILDRYAEILKDEAGIRQLAQLLGRWRDAETETEEELLERQIAKSEWRTVPGLRGEIHGVHESGELTNVLPAETALLGSPVTETLFFQKYVERRLLTFEFRGREAVRGHETLYEQRTNQKNKERGPFIVCVDTSGSMEGLPERIAKVLCFAVLRMAAREQRHAYLINFGVGLNTINLRELATSMDKIVDFLAMRFDGGTDISPALNEALRMLDTEDYRDADVLMVSDFIMYSIREDLVRDMRKRQKGGTRFHSLTIAGTHTNPEMVALFDNYWVYDPENGEVIRRMADDVRGISQV